MSASEGEEGAGYNRRNLEASLQLQHDAEVENGPFCRIGSALPR